MVLTKQELYYLVWKPNLQACWSSKPKTIATFLYYFFEIYNFYFYWNFVESTSSELNEFQKKHGFFAKHTKKKSSKVIFFFKK